MSGNLSDHVGAALGMVELVMGEGMDASETDECSKYDKDDSENFHG